MSFTGKYCLDANTLIAPWHSTYPVKMFPDLWNKLATFKDTFILIKPMLDEIDNPQSNDKKKLKNNPTTPRLPIKYPLRTWIEKSKITPEPIDDKVQSVAISLEKKYTTEEIGKGANHNDILLLAFAKEYGHAVVTLEGWQKQKPEKKSNYKIPLICTEEDITCFDFIAFLQKAVPDYHT